MYRHQVNLETLKSPVCISSATRITSLDEVRTKLDAAGIPFAAMLHEPDVTIHVEPQYMDRVERAGVHPEMYPSKIVVRDGRVISAEKWVLWNGTPWPTITVSREGDQFRSDIGEPEHGGSITEGSIEWVLTGLHPNAQAQYRRLFQLDEPTEEAIRQVGFKREYIEFQ